MDAMFIFISLNTGTASSRKYQFKDDKIQYLQKNNPNRVYVGIVYSGRGAMPNESRFVARKVSRIFRLVPRNFRFRKILGVCATKVQIKCHEILIHILSFCDYFHLV